MCVAVYVGGCQTHNHDLYLHVQVLRLLVLPPHLIDSLPSLGAARQARWVHDDVIQQRHLVPVQDEAAVSHHGGIQQPLAQRVAFQSQFLAEELHL